MRFAFRLPDWSLRTRLLLLLVGLAVVGLAAADFASYRALHNYLYDRVDQQLESAVQPFSARLSHKAGKAPIGGERQDGGEAGVGGETGVGGEAGPRFGPGPAVAGGG